MDTAVMAIFALISLGMVVLGILFIAAPNKMLFLIPKERKHEYTESKAYKASCTIGGLLMIFVAAPMNYMFGALAKEMFK